MKRRLIDMYENKSSNIYIQQLHSWGFSCLTLSYYLSGLVLKLVPFTGVDRRGFARYSDDIFASTSIDRNGAALLISHIVPVLSGKDLEKAVQVVIPCRSDKAVSFEYRPDEERQMSAYLSVSDREKTIPFKFTSNRQTVYEDGKQVTKVEHIDLPIFLQVLEGYSPSNGNNTLCDPKTDTGKTASLLYDPKLNI